MTGFKIVNLKIMVEEIGEERTRELLSTFSCPQNPDVERFLTKNAIEFAKQDLSQTHLVFASHKNKPEIVGYFCLAYKYITIRRDVLSGTQRRKISKFATYSRDLQSYCLSAPLIAQLGKNFSNGLNQLITGDELLKIACDKVASVQFEVGGRFVYVECEDKEILCNFYRRNGFFEFDHRLLDKDETGLTGEYLVQLLRYNH